MDKMTAVVRVNDVYGPSQYGFYDIKTTGPDGDLKLSTKNRDVASAAAGFKGTYCKIAYSTKVVDKDGRTFTNHYLDSVEKDAGAIVSPAPVEPAKPAASGRSQDQEIRIMRQSALQRALMAYGPITASDQVNEYVNGVLALSERFLNYFQHGPIGSQQDDLPF